MQTLRHADGKALRKTVRVVPEARMGLLLAATVVLALALHFGIHSLWISVPVWLALASLLLEGESYVPKSPLALAAPISGRILDARRARDPWLERDAWRVSISPSSPAAASIHSATEGKCSQQWSRRKGGCSHHASMVSTDEGDDVVVELASAMPFRHRLRVNYQPGDRVGQGQRVGYMFLTGTVNIYAPATSICLVQEGQPVSAAEPVLELVHAKPASINAIPGDRQ